LFEVKGPWSVSFNPKWGGPKNIIFEKLEDWTKNSIPGVKYYSGIANYHHTLDLPSNMLSDKNADLFLDLGEVANLARIRLNGKDLGVVWTTPFIVKITEAAVPGTNQIDIEVANLWPNRLIGDEQFPDEYYKKESELLRSGLIGPVRLLKKAK